MTDAGQTLSRDCFLTQESLHSQVQECRPRPPALGASTTAPAA